MSESPRRIERVDGQEPSSASPASVSCLRSCGFVVLAGNEDRDARRSVQSEIASQPKYMLRVASFLASRSEGESALRRAGAEWREEFKGKYYVCYANGPIFCGVIEDPSNVDTEQKIAALLVRLDQQIKDMRATRERPWTLDFETRGVEVLSSTMGLSAFSNRVESGRFGVVRCNTQEAESLLSRLVDQGLDANDDEAMWLILFGKEPTISCFLVDDDRVNLRGIMEGMLERQRQRRVFFPLRVLLPQGNEVSSTIPLRSDVERLLTEQMQDAVLLRIQAQWSRLRSTYDLLLSTSSCSICNRPAAEGSTHDTVRLVERSVEVEVRRLCTRCSETFPLAVLRRDGQVGLTYRDDLEAARRRAEVRVAAERGSAASLLFAMERYLNACLPADAEDFLSAARRLADLMHSAPHVARGATSLLSRIPLGPRPPHLAVSGRQCSACGEKKEEQEFTRNQWRSSRRRCRQCQSECVPRREATREERIECNEIVSGVEELSLQGEVECSNEEERDQECAICYQKTPESERSLLHSESRHWTCGPCFADLKRHGVRSCPLCREALS